MSDLRYLLDSNIIIYLLGGRSPAARARIELMPVESVAASAISYAEVLMGARALDAQREVHRLFARLQILPFDAEAGAAYASVPFKRARFDRLIAAHALSRGLTLVTNNERDFADIPGLKVENWTQ